MIFPIRSKSKLTEKLYQKYDIHIENFVKIKYHVEIHVYVYSTEKCWIFTFRWVSQMIFEKGWLSINIETEKSRGICTADQLASKFPISHYYKILGVKADTKPEEIKKAYFDKSKRYHPDLYPDDKGKLPP